MEKQDYPTVNATVIDADTIRYGGSFFRRVSDEEREKEYQKLEQRCAQLEQVARNLFNKVLDHNRLGIYGGVDISDFRDQLEALGVLCDD